MRQLSPEIASLLADPLQSGFLDKLAPFITDVGAQMGPTGKQDLAYVLSKTAVRSIPELRADAWGAKGARINSISPGVILTPMGRSEPAAAAHGMPPLSGAGEPRWTSPWQRNSWSATPPLT